MLAVFLQYAQGLPAQGQKEYEVSALGTCPSASSSRCHAGEPYECVKGLMFRACSDSPWPADECESFCVHADLVQMSSNGLLEPNAASEPVRDVSLAKSEEQAAHDGSDSMEEELAIRKMEEAREQQGQSEELGSEEQLQPSPSPSPVPAYTHDQERQDSERQDSERQSQDQELQASLQEIGEVARDAMDQIPGSVVLRSEGADHPTCVPESGCHVEQPFECLKGLLFHACSPVAFRNVADCEAYCYHAEFAEQRRAKGLAKPQPQTPSQQTAKVQQQQQQQAKVPPPPQQKQQQQHEAFRSQQQAQKQLSGFRSFVTNIRSEEHQAQESEKRELQQAEQQQAQARMLGASPALKDALNEENMNVSMMASLINSDTNLTLARTLHEQALDKVKASRVALDAALQKMSYLRAKQAHAEVAAERAGQVLAHAKDDARAEASRTGRHVLPWARPPTALVASPSERGIVPPPSRKWEPI